MFTLTTGARPQGTYTPTPGSPGPDRLAELLAAGSRGDRDTAAAVDLLAAHGDWLHHAELLDTAVRVGPDPTDGRFEAAWVDFTAAAAFAGELRCSLSARCVLLFAAELAGVPTGLSTAALLRGMGPAAARLAIAAAKRTASIERPGQEAA